MDITSPQSPPHDGDDEKRQSVLHVFGDGDESKVDSEPDVGSSHGDCNPNRELVGLRLLVLHCALCLCVFLVGLDFTLIATAVPTITSEFHSVKNVGWYGGAFYLTLCVCTPLSGKLFILFPKKPVYLIYVAIFEIGSLVCALAPNSDALIVGRAIAGAGASGIFSGSLVIVTVIIPLHRRAIWQGAITSSFAVASVVGPVIGGALTQHVSWRWCFYINLPVGGVAAFIILLVLNVQRAETENATLAQKFHRLDLIGFTLIAASIFMLLLALEWGGTTYAWNSSVIIGLFVGSGCIFPFFIFQQLRRKNEALIPPQIFVNRNFSLIFASTFFSSGSFQVVVYWLPIWFQAVVGISPTASGVRWLPIVISDVLTGFIGAGLMQALGFWNPFLLLGLALQSIGSGLLTTLCPSITEGHWIGYEIICGIGYSLIVLISIMGAQISLPPDMVAIGSTTILFMTSVSSAIWLSVGQAVFQERFVNLLTGNIPTDIIHQTIATGATQLRFTLEEPVLSVVLHAYGSAITDVFYIPAAAPVLAFLLICNAKWSSSKPIGDEEGDDKVMAKESAHGLQRET